MLHVACTSIGPYKLLKEGADFTHTRLKHLNVIGASRSEPHSTEFYAFRGIYIIGASAAKPHMDDTSGIFHILSLLLLYIDVRRTALILRCGAQRVNLLRMLIVV